MRGWLTHPLPLGIRAHIEESSPMPRVDEHNEPDDELLEAALAFLDAYDERGVITLGPAQTLDGSVRPIRTKPRAVVAVNSPLQVEIRYTHEPSPSQPPVIEAVAAATPRPKRPNYKKREIERLRNQVHLLEVIIKQRKSAGKAWQDVARRQLHQRRRSEADHAELLAAIDEQSEFIGELQQLLARYQRRADRWSRLGVALPPDASQRDTPSDSVVSNTSFDDLIEALDAMPLQIGTVLSDSRLNTRDSSVYVSTQRAGNQIAIQALSARTLPFNHDDVVDAVWQHLLLRSAGSRYEQIAELPNNTYATQCLARMQVGHLCAMTYAKTVLRRVEHEGVVVILRAATFLFADDDESRNQPTVTSLIRVPVHQFLWAAVSRVQNGDGSFEENESQVQCCSVAVLPLHLDTTEAATSEFLARSMETYAIKMNEDTENCLLAMKAARGFVQ